MKIRSYWYTRINKHGEEVRVQRTETAKTFEYVLFHVTETLVKDQMQTLVTERRYYKHAALPNLPRPTNKNFRSYNFSVSFVSGQGNN